MDANKQEQLKTDREFEKKEWANASFLEKFLSIFVPIAGMIIWIVVSLMIFIFKGSHPCDIDKVGLWCKTHPMTGWDVLGYVLFTIGIAFITSILPRLFIRLGWLEDDDDRFPGLYLLSAVLAIGGFAIMYAV